MNTISQLLRLTILLPIWATLFAVTLLAEFAGRFMGNEQALPVGLRMTANQATNSPARQEAMLTARTAQV